MAGSEIMTKLIIVISIRLDFLINEQNFNLTLIAASVRAVFQQSIVGKYIFFKLFRVLHNSKYIINTTNYFLDEFNYFYYKYTTITVVPTSLPI